MVGRGVVWQGEAFQFIFETGCFGNELFGTVGQGRVRFGKVWFGMVF
jgi:hypothetical protein